MPSDPVGEMSTRTTRMLDGRYLIYFDFGHGETEPKPPANKEDTAEADV